MKFFSKFVFICNLCFLVTVAMHFVDAGNNARGKTDVAIAVPFVEGTMAVLGLISLLVNAIFCLLLLLMIRSKVVKQIPIWIVIFNFIALLAEVYWYILDK